MRGRHVGSGVRMTREHAVYLWGAYWKAVEVVLDDLTTEHPEATDEEMANVEDKFDIIGDILYREWAHLLGNME